MTPSSKFKRSLASSRSKRSPPVELPSTRIFNFGNGNAFPRPSVARALRATQDGPFDHRFRYLDLELVIGEGDGIGDDGFSGRVGVGLAQRLADDGQRRRGR